MNPLSKKISVLILLAILAAALTGCGIFASEEVNKTPEIQRYSAYFDDCFDTGITILAYCSSEADFNKLTEAAHEQFREYHRISDIYNDGGADSVFSLNRDKTITLAADSKLLELLEYSKDICGKTMGKTNVAMGSVLKLWHNARDINNSESSIEKYLPSDEELAEAAKHIDPEFFLIEKGEKSTVSFSDSEMSLDLGSIAKGFATQKIGRIIEESGLADSFIISSGGNCYCSGLKPDGSSWIIGVQNPADTSTYVERVELSDICVATSGDYFRYFEVDGVRYCHIIDPVTLMPADKYSSVTVISDDAGLCDALSTALFISDMEEGKEILKVFSDHKAVAMWILQDQSIVYSEGFEDYLK